MHCEVKEIRFLEEENKNTILTLRGGEKGHFINIYMVIIKIVSYKQMLLQDATRKQDIPCGQIGPFIIETTQFPLTD